MTPLQQEKVSCPYCAELIEVLLDAEEEGQRYIEDCQVCCRPITLSVFTDFDGRLTLSVHDENESF